MQLNHDIELREPTLSLAPLSTKCVVSPTRSNTTMSAADDPFACRLAFTKLLSRLNASAGASKQCAQFALRNRELDEDLFNVILEQLQSVFWPC